jgi:hemolysin activation/secretion protein
MPRPSSRPLFASRHKWGAALCIAAGIFSSSQGSAFAASSAAQATGAAQATTARQTKAAQRSTAVTAPATASEPVAPPQQQVAPPQQLPEFYIKEYRVNGAHHLTSLEIETAVYPYLGPGRTTDDVEGARAALAKVYQDKNYSSIEVTVPPQTGAGGIVYLQVNELPVGRLRVEGSRYFDINHIKQDVPALAEGQLIDFSQAQKQLIGINQLPDRRITPVIQSGVTPGTMDVDLNVKDSLPLHGSIELNNRYSSDTPSLRLDASLSYTNLWQLGHSIGGSLQVSPQDVSKVQVYTGFYTIPVNNNLSFTLQATKQNSNVSTLGSIDVTGKGDLISFNSNFKLPTVGDYFQNFTFGINYKDFNQAVRVGADTTATETPTIYLPLIFDYSGTIVGHNFLTDLDLQVVLNLSGIGSSANEFDDNRFGAKPDFAYLRGDVAQTQDLPAGFQLYGKITGQVADGPLINSEQFSAGGLDTVRGYLESEVLGDNAVVGNFEFRLPSALEWIKSKNGAKPGDDWRFYFFTDAASVENDDVLPEQTARFSLASYGGGTRITLFDHFNGSLDLAVPLFSQTATKAQHPFVTFRLWTEF